MNNLKPFRQVPSCDADTVLSITGAEFDAIQNVINIFKSSVSAVDSIFNRNINEGKIVIRYIQEDGTEISKEEVTKFLEEASKIINSDKNEKN